MFLRKRSKSPDATWYVKFRCKGKAYEWCTKTSDKALAMKRAKLFRENVKAEAFNLVASMKARNGLVKIKDVLAEYLAMPAPPEPTRKANLSALRQVMKAGGVNEEHTLERIDKGLIIKWQQATADNPAGGNATLRKAKSVFSRNAMYRYTLRVPREVIADFMAAPFLKVPRRLPELPTPEAMIKAHETLPTLPKAWKAFLCGAYIGMRSAEVVNFRKDWIDRATCRVYIGGKEGFATKSRDWRVVRVQPQILETLLADDGSLPPYSDYVLGDCRRPVRPGKRRRSIPPLKGKERIDHGGREVFMDRVMVATLHELNFPSDKPFHSLRRWFGSQIAEKQGLWKAKDALGHSSQAVTEASYARQLNAAEPVTFQGAIPAPVAPIPFPDSQTAS